MSERLVRAYARRWYTLGVLCLSLLIIVVDTTIVNVALPTFARDLHASSSGLQWIVDAYTLTFAALLLPDWPSSPPGRWPRRSPRRPASSSRPARSWA